MTLNQVGQNAKAVMGESANEIWLRTGQILGLLGVLSYLGIGLSGMDINGERTEFAPLVVIVLSMCLMLYGTKLRKDQQIKIQRHEMALADRRGNRRGKPIPSRGDEAFLEWISPQLPLNDVELSNIDPFPYDSKRTKPELMAALASKRINWWVHHGDIIKRGGTYDLRKNADKTDATVLPS